MTAKRGAVAGARATRELRVLNAVTDALSGASDVGAALQRALELVAELLDLRTG